MTRVWVPLVLCLFGFAEPASRAAGQVPPPPTPPPPPTGAAVPGMPPRDASGTTPQTGTARIRGRVTAAATGEPLRRAQVTLNTGTPGSRSTTTDADGRYEFSQLAPGQFTVSATKAGYVNLQYGQRRPFEGGTPVSVQDGQTVERVDLGLPRGGVMLVRVTDDFGEPIAGARIQLQRYQYQADGRRRLTAVGAGGIAPLTGTDDLGELRVYGLMPGEYVVSASMPGVLPAPRNPADAATEGLSPTFYPGVISADSATPVSVGVGQQVPVQFSMIAARLARISGVVVDSQGRPVGGVPLSLVVRTPASISSSGAGSTQADGTFTIAGVAPGEYAIDVRPSPAAAGAASTLREGASFPIAVAGVDIAGIQIVTSPGTHISGRVIWEGASSRESQGVTGAALRQRITLNQTDPMRQMIGVLFSNPQANGTLDEDGRFEISGASGRVFFNLTPMPPNWSIKSVVLDGRDLTDEPLDLTGRPSLGDVVITLTDRQTSVSGQVVDGRGQLLRDYVVVIQPALELEAAIAARGVRAVRPNASDGRFETRGLRPGRYLATAIDALEQGREFAPEFRQQLRRGAREFRVDEGQSVTLDLRLTPDL